MNKRPLTPREKLQSERLRLRQACIRQEQLLNEEFIYVQEHAHSLLMTGLSALLFPHPKNRTNEKTDNKPAVSVQEKVPISIGLSDYLSIAQNLLPVAWDIVRPLLTAWGIKKVQSWIIRKLFTKKKAKGRNCKSLSRQAQSN